MATSLDESRAPGRIARIVDRNGNTLRFGYGATGGPAVITDTYALPHRLTGITDRAGAPLLHIEYCNDTDGHFYYPTDGSNLPWNAFIETQTLREEADAYEQFTLDFFLP